MIFSMTGFGRGTGVAEGIEATVEMRSVNNRFCEVSVRGPRSLAEHETAIQARIKEAFARGRFSVQIQVTRPDALALTLDEEAARAHAAILNKLRQVAGIDEPVRLEHLLQVSDLITRRDDEDLPAAWPAVAEALEGAIDQMRTMRRQEGEALEVDLRGRIEALAALLARAEERAPERVDEARTRLHDRVAELMSDDRIDAGRLDPDRLEQEIVLLADKLDVTEESVRLHSHLQLFTEALANDEAVGRKLNFITQEINREVNTIGSKANDAALAHLAVQMKEELEKIREQVQNVE